MKNISNSITKEQLEDGNLIVLRPKLLPAFIHFWFTGRMISTLVINKTSGFTVFQ